MASNPTYMDSIRRAARCAALRAQPDLSARRTIWISLRSSSSSAPCPRAGAQDRASRARAVLSSALCRLRGDVPHDATARSLLVVPAPRLPRSRCCRSTVVMPPVSSIPPSCVRWTLCTWRPSSASAKTSSGSTTTTSASPKPLENAASRCQHPRRPPLKSLSIGIT
jgi:hypothetical protein